MQRGAGRDDIRPFQRDPHSKNQQLCRGLDVTAEPTTSGVDATRPPLDRAAAITRSLLGDDPTHQHLSLLATGPDGWSQLANFTLMGLLVIAVAALTSQQPPDRRARSNQ